MSRFSAFAIHLGISLIIFIGLAYLVVFEWYPGMFFDIDGGWNGMRIITAVDLVLGPTLTLAVYKAGKKGLRMDLTLIGLLQVTCLVIGTYVVYIERPIAVAYNDGGFAVMSTDDYVRDAGIEVPDLRHFPGDYPKWVLVEIPSGLDEEADFRSKYLREKRLLNTAVEQYRAFDLDHPQFTSKALDVSLIQDREEGPAAIQSWLEEHGGTLEDYSFYTLSTRYQFGYLGFRKDSGERVGMLTLSAMY
jgi:hypothetical protein